MHIAPIRELYEARPFAPFTFTLADGRKLKVIHNEFLAFFQTARFVILTHPDATFTLIDLLMVTSVDVDPFHATRRPKAAAKKK